ncbi:MAG: hypothetical protein H7A22_06190 [Spirochaetales bacterium]|nr:hypothetical protein [Spirochaetales bacterium]
MSARIMSTLCLGLVLWGADSAAGQGPTITITLPDEERVLRFTEVNQPALAVRVSESTGAQFSHIQEPLAGALVRLRALFGNPPAERGLTVWMVSSAPEMQLLLAEQTGEKLEPEQIAMVRVHEDNLYLMVHEGVPPLETLRLVLQEESMRLIRRVGYQEREQGVGWFYTGMAGYLSWYVAATELGQNRTGIERRMQAHYARSFNSENAIDLAMLERWKDWTEQLVNNPGPVYAQAVLAYLFLAQKTQPTIGVTVLRVSEAPDDFQFAFERATGMRLYQFEMALRDELYPTLRPTPQENAAPAEGGP